MGQRAGIQLFHKPFKIIELSNYYITRDNNFFVIKDYYIREILSQFFRREKFNLKHCTISQASNKLQLILSIYPFKTEFFKKKLAHIHSKRVVRRSDFFIRNFEGMITKSMRSFDTFFLLSKLFLLHKFVIAKPTADSDYFGFFANYYYLLFTKKSHFLDLTKYMSHIRYRLVFFIAAKKIVRHIRRHKAPRSIKKMHKATFVKTLFYKISKYYLTKLQFKYNKLLKFKSLYKILTLSHNSNFKKYLKILIFRFFKKQYVSKFYYAVKQKKLKKKTRKGKYSKIIARLFYGRSYKHSFANKTKRSFPVSKQKYNIIKEKKKRYKKQHKYLIKARFLKKIKRKSIRIKKKFLKNYITKKRTYKILLKKLFYMYKSVHRIHFTTQLFNNIKFLTVLNIAKKLNKKIKFSPYIKKIHFFFLNILKQYYYLKNFKNIYKLLMYKSRSYKPYLKFKKKFFFSKLKNMRVKKNKEKKKRIILKHYKFYYLYNLYNSLKFKQFKLNLLLKKNIKTNKKKIKKKIKKFNVIFSIDKHLRNFYRIKKKKKKKKYFFRSKRYKNIVQKQKYFKLKLILLKKVLKTFYIKNKKFYLKKKKKIFLLIKKKKHFSLLFFLKKKYFNSLIASPAKRSLKKNLLKYRLNIKFYPHRQNTINYKKIFFSSLFPMFVKYFTSFISSKTDNIISVLTIIKIVKILFKNLWNRNFKKQLFFFYKLKSLILCKKRIKNLTLLYILKKFKILKYCKEKFLFLIKRRHTLWARLKKRKFDTQSKRNYKLIYQKNFSFKKLPGYAQPGDQKREHLLKKIRKTYARPLKKKIKISVLYNKYTKNKKKKKRRILLASLWKREFRHHLTMVYKTLKTKKQKFEFFHHIKYIHKLRNRLRYAHWSLLKFKLVSNYVFYLNNMFRYMKINSIQYKRSKKNLFIKLTKKNIFFKHRTIAEKKFHSINRVSKKKYRLLKHKKLKFKKLLIRKKKSVINLIRSKKSPNQIIRHDGGQTPRDAIEKKFLNIAKTRSYALTNPFHNNVVLSSYNRTLKKQRKYKSKFNLNHLYKRKIPLILIKLKNFLQLYLKVQNIQIIFNNNMFKFASLFKKKKQQHLLTVRSLLKNNKEVRFFMSLKKIRKMNLVRLYFQLFRPTHKLKKFFLQSDLVVPILYLFFKRVSTTYFLNIFSVAFKKMKKQKPFLNYIKNLFDFLYYRLYYKFPITGLKFQIKGRIEGSHRKKCIKYIYGRTSLQTLTRFYDYSADTIYTKSGAFGVKIWRF